MRQDTKKRSAGQRGVFGAGVGRVHRVAQPASKPRLDKLARRWQSQAWLAKEKPKKAASGRGDGHAYFWARAAPPIVSPPPINSIPQGGAASSPG